MNRKLTIIVPALLAVSLALVQASRAQADKTMQTDTANFTCDGNFFTAKVPEGWAKSESISLGRQAKEYGVDFKGPKDKDGAYARISLTYYGPDHRRFKTMEKYINLNSRPLMAVKGEKYGPVANITAASRRGKRFERRTFDFIPPYAVKPLKVSVFEVQVVLPGKKGGFYALTYHAPMDIEKANMPVFDKVLLDFKPNN